ncbi:Uncharacterised protein [Vibrio cholerae]|nr:Uncharacterised protein [Vibrio cholerae]
MSSNISGAIPTPLSRTRIRLCSLVCSMEIQTEKCSFW